MRRLYGLILSIGLHGGVLALACVTVINVDVPRLFSRSKTGEAESFAVRLRPADAPAVVPAQREAAAVREIEVGEVPAELTADQPEINFDLFSVHDSSRKPAKEYSASDQPMGWPRGNGERMGGGNAGEGMGVNGPNGTTPVGSGPGGSGTGDGPGDGPAVEAYNPAPEYPTSARRRGAEGSVLVEISVGADGTAEDAKVVEGSGADDLDAAAVAAVKNWKFRPAVRAGQPVASRERIRFVFKLKA